MKDVATARRGLECRITLLDLLAIGVPIGLSPQVSASTESLASGYPTPPNLCCFARPGKAFSGRRWRAHGRGSLCSE